MKSVLCLMFLFASSLYERSGVMCIKKSIDFIRVVNFLVCQAHNSGMTGNVGQVGQVVSG